jgi:hypothetical protein
MQRAAAGSKTPASAPPLKRRRIEHESNPPTPSPFNRSSSQVFSTAIKRSGEVPQDTPNRTLQNGDETEWILHVKLPAIIPGGETLQNSYNVLQDAADNDYDDEEDDIWNNQTSGRQTYGSFQRKKPQSHPQPSSTPNDADLSPASGSDSDSRSIKRPRTDRSNNLTTKSTTSNSVSRPTQAPKRFFDQISTSGSPSKAKKHKKNKQNKKPRITI